MSIAMRRCACLACLLFTRLHASHLSGGGHGMQVTDNPVCHSVQRPILLSAYVVHCFAGSDHHGCIAQLTAMLQSDGNWAS